jgi:hypothetical protein
MPNYKFIHPLLLKVKQILRIDGGTDFSPFFKAIPKKNPFPSVNPQHPFYHSSHNYIGSSALLAQKNYVSETLKVSET